MDYIHLYEYDFVCNKPVLLNQFSSVESLAVLDATAKYAAIARCVFVYKVIFESSDVCDESFTYLHYLTTDISGNDQASLCHLILISLSFTPHLNHANFILFDL